MPDLFLRQLLFCPKIFIIPYLTSEKQRNQLRLVVEKESISYAVASVSCEEIDQINILNASFLAMHKSIEKLSLIPEQLLIDGNRFKPYMSIPHHCIVKGDGKFASIAAASILAKTYRDEYMLALHNEFPQYKWNRNKGYGTLDHRNAIEKHGICAHHRKSFNILPENKGV